MPGTNVPGLDSDVNKAFSLEAIKLALSSGIHKGNLQRLAIKYKGEDIYPTAVYVGNQIVNLLLDMTGSIRSDDPRLQQRSGEFFNGGLLEESNIENITGVAAYKVLSSVNRDVTAGVQASVNEVVSV